MFITPLALLLAETTTLGYGSADMLITARFLDTALECTIGLMGGFCLNSPIIRRLVNHTLQKLVPRQTFTADHADG